MEEEKRDCTLSELLILDECNDKLMASTLGDARLPLAVGSSDEEEVDPSNVAVLDECDLSNFLTVLLRNMDLGRCCFATALAFASLPPLVLERCRDEHTLAISSSKLEHGWPTDLPLSDLYDFSLSSW